MTTPTQQRELRKFGASGSGANEAGRRWLSILQGVLAQPAAAWLLLGIGLLATLVTSFGAWRQIRSRDEVRFIARTEILRDGLVQELDRYVRLLNGVRALWGGHPPVVGDEWRTYVESLELSASFPGLQALGYVEQVPGARLPGYEEQVRRAESRGQGTAGFQVHPQVSADEHYVVRFVEPLASNRPALGYDIGSDPIRRQAAEQARDTGKATLTRKIALVQAPQAPGVLLLLPVYSTGLQATNVARRRASLRGLVYAGFVVEELVARLRRPGSEDVEMQVFDGAVMSPAAQLAGRPGLPMPDNAGLSASFERMVRLDCGNTVWTLRFQSGPGFPHTPWFSAPGYIPAAGLGLCISLLAFGMARATARTRQHAEALAIDMTAQLRLQHDALASAKNGIFILDATRDDGPIIYANPAFERMTGHGADERLGKTTISLLRSDVVRPQPSDMHRVLAAGGAGHPVLREYRKNGSHVWAEFRLVPVLNEAGRTTHFLGIVEDVTERKRAEEQLVSAEQRYLELVSNLPVGVYRNTPGEEGLFVEVNPALVAMFEAESKAELMRCSVSALYADPARRRELSEKIARQSFVKDEEVELKTLRGRRFWASISATMKADRAGAAFFDGIVADITERKLAEAELRVACGELSRSQESLQATVNQLQAANDELRRAQLQLIQAAKLESIGTLAAGIAHEVKNPLQTILMGVDYLAGCHSAAGDTTGAVLKDMRDAIGRANRIVRELLELSAARDLDRKAEDLNDVLERSLLLLRHELAATQTNVVRQLQPSLPPVPIDRGKIQQVLLNLFINALQAMPVSGTLTISTRAGCLGKDLSAINGAVRRFQPGDRLVVAELQDTGPGIPEAHLPRIFDPFFTTKPAGVGTGLGLGVAKKIMELHEGAVDIQNVPEGGVRVTLVFRA